MKSPVMKSMAVSLGILLTGCAGTNFVRITDVALVLGETTYGQITARLGSPYREGVVTKNNLQIKTASYAYSAGGEAAGEGVIAARSQGFYFYNNKLVGYEFTSSWKEDSTDFDSRKVSQIRRGSSTRNDVIRLLGDPGGKLIYPIIPNSNENAVSYLYNQTKGSVFNLKFYQKQLVVTFNRQGVVTNVEYTESGQK